MEGTIIMINKKYVILDDKRIIEDTEILHGLLPNDIVSYHMVNGKISIDRLISRKSQTHIGIVKYVSHDMVTVVFPNLPNYVNLQVQRVYDPTSNVYSVLLVNFTNSEMCIVDKYKSIKDRTIDKYLFLKLYVSTAELCNITPIYEENSCYYTEDFKDLTGLYTFNVDPTESKDFDDALSVDENKIYVHIVDINEQILKLSDIDTNSLRKSFTLYLPEHIQNILPSYLAENELSLVKNHIRKVITIEFTIDDKTQDIINYSIYKSIITVKKRYNYEEFNEELYKFPTLINFYHKWKRNTLNIPHVKLNVNKHTGELIDYKLENYSNDAHKIIETMMILTNLTTSQHIKNIIPQRFHSKINPELNLQSYTNNNIIDSILTIKNYKSAIYDTNRQGHFGLSLNSYTHFTSPIRRYFDVIIHRLYGGIIYKNVEEVLEHINKQELFVEKIVSCYNNLKFLSYFENHLDNIWSGFILSITTNGVVVLLEGNLYEIFIFEHRSFNMYDKVNIKIKNINWFNLSVKAIII